jgi:uncharacterized protein (TIGR02611 family)
MRMLRKTGVTVLGWSLLVVGVAALALPGPGLLLLLAGMVILSQEYDWAERRVEPIKMKAFEVAASGVRTWPRILGSTLGGLCVIAAGIFWWLDPDIPEIWIIGPELPLGGWATGSGIVLSGLVAVALVVYSVRRFRGKSDEEAAAEGRFVPGD